MSDEQAQRNVRLVSRALLDMATQLRMKLNDARLDELLTMAERNEVQNLIDQAAGKLEAKSRWWITGDGAVPE